MVKKIIVQKPQREPVYHAVHCDKCHSTFTGIGMTVVTAKRVAEANMRDNHTPELCFRIQAANKRGGL